MSGRDGPGIRKVRGEPVSTDPPLVVGTAGQSTKEPVSTDPPLVVGTAGQSTKEPVSTDPPLVVGTAGHIDHGKTALITLLTGTNTDRLREERERGISIELGYAELVLPSGRRLSVVDVPGHERFVRTMVAGATGVDLFLLVVAADDGVMPQTVEHLAVIELLGVQTGVVAITKADLVDEELLELARADVEELLAGTRYRGAPVVPVSARDGRGVPELLEALEQAAAQVTGRRRSGPARMPVDRVFSLQGVGTVVTGTLWRGEVRAGDELGVEPGGEHVVVRDVQVHEHDEEVAVAGRRVGLNVRGSEVRGGERGALKRGAWLAASAPAARTTASFDAWLRLLPGAPKVSSGDRLRFHHGTGQRLGRVQLLDRDTLTPEHETRGAAGGASGSISGDGETASLPGVRGGAAVRVRLEGPDLLEPGDRFVVRALSPAATVGGGIVLDIEPVRWRDRDAQSRYLAALAEGDAATAIVERAKVAGPAGVAAADLGATTVAEEAAAGGRAAVDHGELEPLTGDGRRWSVPGTAKELDARLLEVLETRARERPDRPALTAAEQAAALGGGAQPRAERQAGKAHGAPPGGGSVVSGGLIPQAVVAAAAARLVADGRAVQTDEGLAHPSAGVLDAAREDLATRVLAALSADPFSPPTTGALLEKLGGGRRDLVQVLDVLVRRGEAVRVKGDIYFTSGAVDEARERAMAALEENGSISLAGFRDLLSCGRRNAQALLEHFDGEGLTRRDGDVRVARRR